MVADRVVVESRKAGEANGWRWESDGSGEFTIAQLEQAPPRGTAVHLHLREGEDIYLDKFRLKHIVSTYSDHIAFRIQVVDEEGKAEDANKASALWTRPRSEITPAEYQEFYRHVAHQPGEPWMTLHNKAEGKIEYTNLLFIPSERPMDLFHPDRKRSVKLYVKRVFITDEGIDLVPNYLRFLRGVIDSQDLPLNISRETLQKNPLLTHIRESVEKRVLSELKKKAEKDAEAYSHFWKTFGAVLKEGLCEAIAPKEQILECCRFYSIEKDELSLDDYISAMQEGQEFIYYLTGDDAATLRNSPQLEGFRQRGVNVLLLTDHVDDFWVNVVQGYKGKSFLSVTRSSDELDKLSVRDDTAEKDQETPDKPQLEKLLA